MRSADLEQTPRSVKALWRHLGSGRGTTAEVGGRGRAQTCACCNARGRRAPVAELQQRRAPRRGRGAACTGNLSRSDRAEVGRQRRMLVQACASLHERCTFDRAGKLPCSAHQRLSGLDKRDRGGGTSGAGLRLGTLPRGAHPCSHHKALGSGSATTLCTASNAREGRARAAHGTLSAGGPVCQEKELEWPVQAEAGAAIGTSGRALLQGELTQYLPGDANRRSSP